MVQDIDQTMTQQNVTMHTAASADRSGVRRMTGWVPCLGLRKFLPENVTSLTCHFSMIQVLWFGLKCMYWVPCFGFIEL